VKFKGGGFTVRIGSGYQIGWMPALGHAQSVGWVMELGGCQLSGTRCHSRIQKTRGC
jgi:hypothetical protein